MYGYALRPRSASPWRRVGAFAGVATLALAMVSNASARAVDFPHFASSVRPAAGCFGEAPAAWPLARRLSQLMMIGAQFSDPAASATDVAAGVGGLIFFGDPAAASGPMITVGLGALVDSAQHSHHIVPWLSTDEEGGGIARLAGVVGPLPWPRQLAEEYSPSQVRSVVKTHAVALRALGITMDLAPVVDTAAATDGIGEEGLRSFSEDPTTTATYGIAFEAGLAAGGVTGVFKHFPGLGHANADTDLGTAADPPLAGLVEDDLVPFARAAKAGVGVIMVGHPVVAGLTGGLPASLSPAAYGYLRHQIGFKGVAMTDSLDAGAISVAGYGLPAAAVAAIVAGADMVLFTDPTAYPAVLAALESAVASGQLSQRRVNTAVGRILVAKHLRPCPRNRKGEH